MKNYKVSVLIANYNNQIFIDECIHSIKNQTYKNIEIIFHDDCSKDNSLKEIKKFKEVKVIKNKKRSKFGAFNQIKAYQRAFNISSGDIILFLDSDDFFHKSKVKNIVKEFSKNNGLLSTFDLPIIKSDNKIFFKSNKKKILKSFWPYIPPQSCISIKRNYFKKILKEIDFRLYPNIWMDFRIALYLKFVSKKFFILNKNLTFYRQTPQMISSKFTFLSISWWKRRMEAHNYVMYFFLKKNIKYKKNFDYFLTSFVNYLIK